MNTEILSLRDQIALFEYKIKQLQRKLEEKIQNCQHEWSDSVPAHIRHEGYTHPGDPPGTMGVDWRGPTYIEPKIERRWKRRCNNCGMDQYSTQEKEIVTKFPVF